jgi:hypothetical protein
MVHATLALESLLPKSLGKNYMLKGLIIYVIWCAISGTIIVALGTATGLTDLSIEIMMFASFYLGLGAIFETEWKTKIKLSSTYAEEPAVGATRMKKPAST